MEQSKNIITSVQNKEIIEISKLKNEKWLKKSKYFLVEGEHSLENIIEAQIPIYKIFVIEGYNCDLLKSQNIQYVSNAVMTKISTSNSCPKILTVAEKITNKFLDSFSRIILLENISDAGNLGTIIRSAVAFGFDCILLCGNCVDLYNSKVIRSSAGNFFKIPVIKDFDLCEILKTKSLVTTALSLKSSDFSKLPKSNFILAMGAEASGLTKELIEKSDYNYLIQTQNVESLNLAVSSSILMYEFSKLS